MTVLRLRPPVGVESLMLGSDREQVARAMQGLGMPEEFTRAKGDQPGLTVVTDDLIVFGYFDPGGRCDAIEIGCLDRISCHVLYEELEVFATPAEDLIAELRRKTTVTVEGHGHEATAPDLLLAFWRSVVPESPDDATGRFFEGVLVAKPGYYTSD